MQLNRIKGFPLRKNITLVFGAAIFTLLASPAAMAGTWVYNCEAIPVKTVSAIDSETKPTKIASVRMQLDLSYTFSKLTGVEFNHVPRFEKADPDFTEKLVAATSDEEPGMELLTTSVKVEDAAKTLTRQVWIDRHIIDKSTDGIVILDEHDVDHSPTKSKDMRIFGKYHCKPSAVN
jgi:hypothetical protein